MGYIWILYHCVVIVMSTNVYIRGISGLFIMEFEFEQDNVILSEELSTQKNLNLYNNIQFT